MSAQADDRRSEGGRVQFEALVVVDDQGDATYECEAVDVSENGLHLRTAYLPDLGRELTFRFDGGAGEIVAQGSVVWRDEQAKGGEFGVRFSNLDDRSLAALREVCGVDAGSDAAPAPAERGARVKLHIEGLTSPVRARVRDAQRSEVMVGTHLDFLKVGRSIDLEDVEQGKKRLATIDRVDVEVDKETRVPQLIVTLRYDGVEPDASAVATKKESPAAKSASAASEEGDDDEKRTALDAFVDKAKGVAADLGPRLTALSGSTKDAVARLIAKAKARREEAVQADDKPATKRVTSPPPNGARRASSKTRTDKDTEMNDDIELEESDAAKEKQKKRAKIFAASAAGFLVIMLGVFGLRSRSAPPGAEATASTDAAPALPAAPVQAPGAGPAASGDAVTANVPLFGPTPMSTTEAAAPPVDPTAAAAPPADEAAGDEKAEPGDTTFGKGTVSNPKIARLKFDSPLTELKGSIDKHRVVVFVPGHRNIEPASPLAKRDRRLAGVKAVPKDGGVEVTYTFKSDPPPFEAKIDGKLLVMEMGEADEATAKKVGKKKNKAVAKADKKKDKKKAKKAKKHSED